jgi:hypothetical protein
LLVSARTDEWILIKHTDSGDRELYHRPSDPTQQDNILADDTAEPPAILESPEQIVDAHAESSEPGDGSTEDGDDDLAIRPEALGYR